jgi:hypothetical protein
MLRAGRPDWGGSSCGLKAAQSQADLPVMKVHGLSIGILAVSSGGMTAASQSMSAISACAPMASRSAATTARECGSDRRDEKVWLPKGVAVLLSFDHHGFPADNNVLGNGEDAVGEQWPKRSVKPKTNFSSAARILELLEFQS